MTSKVQKIRNEVERLQNELIQEREKGYGSDVDDACILELENVLTYIESLQKEPVSEDLEEEASRYAKEEYSHKSPATLPNRCIGCYAPLMYAFKAGAKWQRKQDEETLKDRIINTYNRGMEQQIMKDAISLKVKETFGKGDEVAWVIKPSKILDKKFNVGEKVKLIVIKEE